MAGVWAETASASRIHFTDHHAHNAHKKTQAEAPALAWPGNEDFYLSLSGGATVSCNKEKGKSTNPKVNKRICVGKTETRQAQKMSAGANYRDHSVVWPHSCQASKNIRETQRSLSSFALLNAKEISPFISMTYSTVLQYSINKGTITGHS